MAITVANVLTNSTVGATTLTLAFVGVTSGSTLIVGIAQSASSSGRTYSVADDVNGSWGAADAAITGAVGSLNRHAEVFSFANSASGDLTVTVTVSSSAAFRIGGLEALGCSGTVDDTDTIEQATSTSLYASNTTGFNPVADSIILSVITPIATVTSSTLDSDYTAITDQPATAPQGVIAYRIVGGANLTDERMLWSVGTTRPAVGASASFTVDAAGNRRRRVLLTAV